MLPLFKVVQHVRHCEGFSPEAISETDEIASLSLAITFSRFVFPI